MTTPGPKNLLAVLVCALLAACGGTSSDGPSSSGGTGSSAGTLASPGSGTGSTPATGSTGGTSTAPGAGATTGSDPTGSATPASPATSSPATPTAGTCPAPAGMPVVAADVAARLKAASIVASGSEGFVAPTGTAELAFEHAFTQLISGDLAGGQSELAPLGFTATMLHPADGGAWVVVEETAPRHGGGTFALNLTPARDLWLEAPHADSDTGTLAETVDQGIALGARAVLITGSNRCADAAKTSCDGSTLVCGGVLRVSDAAHSPDNFFTSAHRALRSAFPSGLAVSVHGMESAGAEAAVVSDGSTGMHASSISIRVRNALNAQLGSGGQQAFSCNDPADSGKFRTLCGTTNAQGRIDNGSADACFSFTSASQNHFLHIEQNAAMRAAGSGSGNPGMLLQALTQAVACTLPGNGAGCPRVAPPCPAS